MTGRVCVGVILGAHGLKGAVRVKSFTEVPRDVAAFGKAWDEAGRRSFAIKVLSEAKGVVTVQMDGVADRTAAEALKGVRLFVERAALPAPEEDEFYYEDLVGLRAETVAGDVLGRVKAVFDFGGGDVIEVRGPEGSAMYAFTRAVVPLVDIAGGRLVIDPPFEVEAEEPDEEGGTDAG